MQRLDPRILYIFRCNDCALEPSESPEVKSFEKLLPGEGIAPISQIMAYLHEVDFLKYVGLELTAPTYAKRAPEQICQKALQSLTKVIGVVSPED
jgi:hypothetical protein